MYLSMKLFRGQENTFFMGSEHWVNELGSEDPLSTDFPCAGVVAMGGEQPLMVQ